MAKEKEKALAAQRMHLTMSILDSYERRCRDRNITNIIWEHLEATDVVGYPYIDRDGNKKRTTPNYGRGY